MTVRERRKARNLSQGALAVAGELSLPFLSRIENGWCPLTPAVAERLAPALGATAEELLKSQEELRERLRSSLTAGGAPCVP
jgi:transcriptional regulator with XRE-family HTH domain